MQRLQRFRSSLVHPVSPANSAYQIEILCVRFVYDHGCHPFHPEDNTKNYHCKTVKNDIYYNYNTVIGGESMTLTSMDYFVMLARERSFTRAAEQLHITQQSLSTHIASLERELGCQLLLRRVPLELTYAGKVFLRYASEFQQNINAMRQEFCDITGNQKGVLRVGIAFTRGRTIMPELIDVFQQNYPNISIELEEASNEALHRNVLNGEIDLAIANFPHALQGIELQDFYKEEVVLLVSKKLISNLYGENAGQIMANVQAGNLSVLNSCPVVMGNSADIAAKIGLAAIHEANIHPPVKAKSDNVETLLALCLRDVGACFCPENLARATLSDEQLEMLNLVRLGENGKYQIRFGYLRQSYQWSILSEFINTAVKSFT